MPLPIPSETIDFHASAFQDSEHPGATIYLSAVIKESGTPIATATVKAKVVLPDGTTDTVEYMQTHPGHFKGSYKTSLPGTYTFHVHAKGTTLLGASFTRKKNVTGAVYYGD